MLKSMNALSFGLLVLFSLATPAAAWNRLVPADAAPALIADGDVRVIDIRHRDLGFDRGHIPGSVSMPLWSWRGPGGSSGVPPSDAELTAMVRKAGLRLDDQILLVHSGLGPISFAAASWVYWVMKSSGFETVAILDGGIKAWKAEAGAITTAQQTFRPSATRVTFSDEWLATTSEVAEIVEGSEGGALLDARVNQVEDAGTITGALSYAMTSLLAPSQTEALSPIDTLERLKGLDVNWEQENVITFCNNGLQGAATWFMASEIAGIKSVKLYSESLQGWTSRPTN